MSNASEEVKIASGYVVLVLFLCAALILLGLSVHLMVIAHKKIKNTSRSNRCNNKAILAIIIVTVIGMLSFFFSVVVLMVRVLDVVFGVGADREPEDMFEYMTVILDQFGHLAMLTVFVIRLKICFEASVYGFSSLFLRFMYSCLLLLMVGSFAIIMMIANESDIEVIIMSEIVWELAVEAMMVWILYLFVSKLQILVKTSLGKSRRNLRLTISYNISQKSRSREVSRNNSQRHSKRSRTSLGGDVTLGRTRTPSPSRSAKPTAAAAAAADEATTPKSPPPQPNQTVLNSQNLVNVMTKMTLLVLIAVFGSIFSMIANIYIQIINLQSDTLHIAQISTMWANLLPVFDMVLASFMLYLQFDFTKTIYTKLCAKWDIMFIQFCGDLLSNKTDKQKQKQQQQSVPSMTENAVSSPSVIQRADSTLSDATTPRHQRLTIDIATTTTAAVNNRAFTPPSKAPPITPKSVTVSPRKPPPLPQRKSSNKINTSFWENAIAKTSNK